jgi:hypothetical protein
MFGGDCTFAFGKDEVKIKDADRRFLDLTEPEGEAFPLVAPDEFKIS